jgi:hypothetical protein
MTRSSAAALLPGMPGSKARTSGQITRYENRTSLQASDMTRNAPAKAALIGN